MKLTILEQDNVWYVGMVDGEDVYPTTSYQSAKQAAARALQLLDLGPTAPQIGPEEIVVNYSKEKISE